MFLCEQRRKEERRNEAGNYTASNRHWLRDVFYHTLDIHQSWRCSIENRTSRHVWFRTYLRFPIQYRTLNSFALIAELKHTLMHKCGAFSASKFFHLFLMSAGFASTRYHRTLSNKITSNRTSQYIPGLMHSMHSVSAESLNFFQVKHSGTQIHTMHFCNAELYPVLIHWWGVYAILLLCSGIRCLIILMSYTHKYYIAGVYSTSIHCWPWPNPNTLLKNIQS